MRVLNHKYAVFFDTNSVKGKHWIDQKVRERAPELGKDIAIAFKLYLPETVKEEWTRYYLRSAHDLHVKLQGIHGKLADMDFTLPDTTDFDEDQARASAESYIGKLGFQVVPTPHSEIDYPMLLELALRHDPPFQPNDGTDKGFKDAVIAETIKNFAVHHPSQKIIFIGRDGLMTEYLTSIIPSGTSFEIYNSIESFEEALNLKNNDLSEELSKGASEAFFVEDVDSTFYFTLNVRDQLLGKYRTKIIDAEAARVHLKSIGTTSGSLPYSKIALGQWKLSSNKSYISDPTFVSKDKENRLHWTTEIDFVQSYEIQSNSSDADGNPIKYLDKHTLTFKVVWSAELSKKGEITKPKIDDVLEIFEIQTISEIQNNSLLNSLLRLQSLVPPNITSLTDSIGKINSSTKLTLEAIQAANKVLPKIEIPKIDLMPVNNPLVFSAFDSLLNPGAQLQKAPKKDGPELK